VNGDTAAPAGGRGRLARLIETRGGKAAPEAPFVIEHREALIYMLCEAAELEHGIMCQYLFRRLLAEAVGGRGADRRRVVGRAAVAAPGLASGHPGDAASRSGA
jgi:hypothetical protein